MPNLQSSRWIGSSYAADLPTDVSFWTKQKLPDTQLQEFIKYDNQQKRAWRKTRLILDFVHDSTILSITLKKASLNKKARVRYVLNLLLICFHNSLGRFYYLHSLHHSSLIGKKLSGDGSSELIGYSASSVTALKWFWMVLREGFFWIRCGFGSWIEGDGFLGLRKTKLVCAIRPACCSVGDLEKLTLGGMNVARIIKCHNTR